MDSDGGPHLCSLLEQNKIQMLISPERLNSRLCTTSLDKCARKDGCYDQYLKQCYNFFGEGNYSTE
jgi:hypothetical protein